MSFKKLFTERASYYREDCNLLEYAFLPLTPTISKILGGGKNQESFHLTSLEYLPGLKKIKGDKSISTFTKGIGSVIQNVNVKPDVLAKLEGNVVLSSDKDAFTHLDKSGMRWINLRTIQNNRRKYDFIWDAFTGKLVRFMNEKYNLNMSQEDIEEKFVCDYWSKLKPKEKKEAKDFYIKHVESLLQNETYSNIIEELLKYNKTEYRHDEVVMNKFKILGVYSIEANKFQYDHSMAQYYIEKAGYKYLGHISKDEFRNVSLKSY